MIDRKKLIRRLSLAAYFLAAFLIFLFLLFPYDTIKGKIESEVRRSAGLDLSIAHISPLFVNSFLLSDVVVSQPGGTVLFESPSVRTSVSLFGLLRKILSVHIKAKAYGGDLVVKAQQGPGRQYLMIDASGLDIGSYSYFKTAGYKLSGKLGGNFEMSGDAGKGKILIKGLTTREIKIKGFPIPDLDFDQCWFEGDIKGDRLTIRKLDLDGKELKASCVGDVVLRERGSINLTVKIKPSERLAQEQAAMLSLLKNRDTEGYYQLTIGGTVAEPMPRF